MSYQGPTPEQPDPQPDPEKPVSGQPTSGDPGYPPPPGYGPPGYGPPSGYGPPGYAAVPGYPEMGPYPPSPDERNMATLAHLLGIVAGLVTGLMFLGPLIIYLIKKDESRFVRHHATEALNLTLTGLIVTAAASLVGCVLTLLVVGIFIFLLLIPYGILLVVYLIIASLAASRGEWYSYPNWLRFRLLS